MGGDFAPDVNIEGAMQSLDQLGQEDEVILVGPQSTIEAKLSALGGNRERIHVVDAPDVISMDDSPVESLRKKPKSSIAILAKLAKADQADAVISAGNTGACVAAFQMRMRNLPGVNRTGIAVVIPTFGGPVVVCDVGANIACKPLHLYQYAVMASAYSRNLLGVKEPKVGILSIGQEDAKGNEVIKKARELIKADHDLTFYGNVEGRDLLKGICDVLVCDGFVGNVMLKLVEGVVDGLFRAIKQELMQEQLQLALMFKPVMMRIYQKYDYNEYGGALLLGVDGTALICHGASQARTIKNAILAAKKFHSQKVNSVISEYLGQKAIGTTDAETS
jgi:glycerol-3-phosphate acyltransferase PlsX